MARASRGVLVLSALWYAGSCFSQAADPIAEAPSSAAGDTRPVIGLVLGGGGARGGAHIGVIKVLEELRVPIDVIAGTSMGAAVGGLYAAGMDAADLERAIADIDWVDIFDDRPPRRSLSFRRKQDDRSFFIDLHLGFKDREFVIPQGLIQGHKFGVQLREWLTPLSWTENFDELPTPFRAVAADIATGEAVVLGTGDLALAIGASMAVPGVISPVTIDDRLLVDGGIADNLPVDVARAMGAEVLIVVDVGYQLLPKEELASAIDIIDQMTTIMTRRTADPQKETLGPADVLIEPPLGDFGSTDFMHAEEAAAIGELAASAMADRLASLSVGAAEYETFLAARARRQMGTPEIEFIRVLSDSNLSPRVIEAGLQTEPGPLDIASVQEDVKRIYGLDIFEAVDFRVVEDHDGETGLEFEAVQKTWGPNYLRFGLGLQSDAEGRAFFNIATRYTMTEVNPRGAEWRNDVQLGSNPRLFSEFYQPLSYNGRYFVAPLVNLDARTLDLFEEGQRVATYRLRSAFGGFDVGRNFGNWGELRLGLRRGFGTARLSTGDPALPNPDFDIGAAILGFSYDMLDSVTFPRRGSALDLVYEKGADALGSSENYDLMTVGGLTTITRGKNTVIVSGEFGTSYDEEVLINFFQLGGFLNLSGLSPGQLSGPHAGIARTVYYRQIRGPGLGPTGLPVYAGFSLEAGNVWPDRNAIALNDLLLGGSLFLGVDTFLGPLYVAGGVAEGGESAVYLFLGQTLFGFGNQVLGDRIVR